MESDSGGFGGAIGDKTGDGNEAGEGGDGDDGAVVGGGDGGEEFVCEAVVGEGIYGEEAGEEGVGGGEDCRGVGDAGVKDEDGGVAVGGAEGGGDGGYVGGGGDVEAEVVDVGVCWGKRVSDW